MTQLEPAERAVVVSVVGDDVMAEDEEALAEALASYRQTVTLLRRHPWRSRPGTGAATATATATTTTTTVTDDTAEGCR